MKRKFFSFIVILFVSVILVGCTLNQNNDPVELDVDFDDMEVIYDGSVHTIELEGTIPSEYEVVYENNSASGVGVYEATAQVVEADTQEVVEEYEATLTIKGVYENVDIIANGEEYVHEMDCEVGEGFVLEYVNNRGSEQGIYYATAKLINEEKNEVVDEYYSVLTIDNEQNEEFDAFLDEIFIMLFEGDQLLINFYFNDYEQYGIEHQLAELAKYEKIEDFEAANEELEVLMDELEVFAVQNLSFEQIDTYNIMMDYFEYIYSVTERMNYMGNSYLGSYLGYQCNLPLELAEYKFREEQDIIDFIGYLNDAPAAFETYVQYTKDQIEYGTATPNYVIDNVVQQCLDFVAMGEDNFLITAFNNKIDNVEFELVEKTKEEYKEEAKTAIIGSLTQAYQYVADNLPALKDNATVEGGLAMYGEEGREYYNILMENVLGVDDFDGEKAIKYLENKVSEVYNEITSVVSAAQRMSQSEYQKFISAVLQGTPQYANLSFEQVVEYFKEVSKELVPELTVMPEISIKYVDESLQDSFSPAAYFVSAIDETRYESIYLNPAHTSDYNYIFITLAHEGYPGHLYQTVYAKSLDIHNVRKIIRCSGYKEGWATYVEHIAYDYAVNYTSQIYKYALQYDKLNSIYNLYINALCDLVIHYRGVTLSEFAAYLSELIDQPYTEENAKGIYHQIAEIPSNSCMYAVSYAIIDELRTISKTKLGSDFNEIEFNKVILDCGAAPFDIVIEHVYEYINEKYFIKHGEIIYK